MVKGSNLAENPSIHCTIHLLQLVVSDSIMSENIVIDVLAKSRRLVTHFNHSSLACSNFKKIQQQQNLDNLCLVEVVPTRWNSTYLMLERFNKLKIPVQLYLAERSDLMTFSTFEWTHIKHY